MFTVHLDDQRRIVAKVDPWMALADQVEARLSTSSATGENSREAIIAEITAAPKAQANPA
jgi:hypothetical protein